VTREPEWDDRERTKMLALGDYEAAVCDCGFHRSQTDPRRHVYKLIESACPVCATVDQYQRIQTDLDDKARKKLGDNRPVGTPDPADGRKVALQRVT
jgi:hypothetical protein